MFKSIKKKISFKLFYFKVTNYYIFKTQINCSYLAQRINIYKRTINYTSTNKYFLLIYQVLFALYLFKYYFTTLMIGLNYKTSANFFTQENNVSLKANK